MRLKLHIFTAKQRRATLTAPGTQNSYVCSYGNADSLLPGEARESMMGKVKGGGAARGCVHSLEISKKSDGGARAPPHPLQKKHCNETKNR